MATKIIEIDVKANPGSSIKRLSAVANRMALRQARGIPGIVEIAGLGWLGYFAVTGSYRYQYEVTTK